MVDRFIEENGKMIDRFHAIADSLAIVRLKGGVQKQLQLYHRGPVVFIPHSGGYLRVVQQLGNRWGTDNPDVFVLELEGPRVCVGPDRCPMYDKNKLGSMWGPL